MFRFTGLLLLTKGNRRETNCRMITQRKTPTFHQLNGGKNELPFFFYLTRSFNKHRDFNCVVFEGDQIPIVTCRSEPHGQGS